MSGFAELWAERERAAEASQTPAGGHGGVEAGERPASTPPPLRDDLPPWVEGLSKDARRTLLYQLERSRNRDPLTVPQEDLDLMTDAEKWSWAEQAVRAEHEKEGHHER